MKKNENYILASIVILMIAFGYQFYTIYKHTTANIFLNRNITILDNDTIYYVLDAVTDMLLEEIDDKENKAITMLTDNTITPYVEYGPGYMYVRNKVLPMHMYLDWDFYLDLKEKDVSTLLKRQKLDYVLLFGKDVNLYNITSTHDYTLYKVIDRENNILEEVKGYDLSLYNLYKKYGINDKKFQSILKRVKKSISEHWLYSSINLMVNFANDLYKNGDYDLAVEYSEYYLLNVDFLHPTLNMNLAEYYTGLGEYDKAISYYKNLYSNANSDTELLDSRIEELEELKALQEEDLEEVVQDD